MGYLLNPGADVFHMDRSGEFYVDKSGLFSYLNRVIRTPERFVCVSRPRRFGKSMAANMVGAYYDRSVDAAVEFTGLEASRAPEFEAYRNRFDVVRINMQDMLSASSNVEGLISYTTRLLVRDIKTMYPHVDLFDINNLASCINDTYVQTGTQFVIVIDEWDCVMREMQADPTQQERYLDFLRSWLKDRAYVALCYMTGILPIKKYGSHFALNMFNEISMTSPYELAPYMGFTEDEVAELCRRKGVDLHECLSWYDGYTVKGTGDASFRVCNPRSVVRAMMTGVFDGYWNETESYIAIQRYIDLDMDGLHGKIVELLAGARVKVDLSLYTNDMAHPRSADDVLVLLIHLGYLTFDRERSEVYIPNREIMGEFASSVRRGEGWNEVLRSIDASEDVLDALVRGDSAAVAAGMERAHEDASSIIAYNDENALAATLRLALFSAIRRWRIVREMPAGKGFADFVLVPLASAPGDTPGIIIELKYGDSAQHAVEQIKQREYQRSLDRLTANGSVLLCGIAYDPKTKTHDCVIERGVYV